MTALTFFYKVYMPAGRWRFKDKPMDTGEVDFYSITMQTFFSLHYLKLLQKQKYGIQINDIKFPTSGVEGHGTINTNQQRGE